MIEKRTHWSRAEITFRQGAYIPTAILCNPCLTPAAKMVYGIMHNMQGRKTTEFLADYSQMAQILNGDRTTIRRAVQLLAKHHLVIIHRGPKYDYPGLFELPKVTRRNENRIWAQRREDENPKVKRMPKPKTANGA